MVIKKDNLSPLIQMHEWIEAEKELGSAHPNRVVLATCSPEGIPHSRVVVVREISSTGILFFTQRRSKKVAELAHNPKASMTLWLPLQQRQVIVDGVAHPLTHQENATAWKTVPREQQLRFSAYAPTSGQVIDSVSVLNERLDALTQKFLGKEVPMSAEYCGFQLVAKTVYFYTLGDNTFSEFLKYQKDQDNWTKQRVSP
ncbi:MAG: Pyridoxine/pyridoxamine 5'-phosphate oxidase [Chlamydiales bacterium]|nr:Pyridoxine/pyridoxamine 5'-phosphate oxidase [Chlamydiales bacterium]